MNRVLILLTLPLLAAGCASTSAPLRQNTTAFESDGITGKAAAALPLIPMGASAEEVRTQLGEPTHIRAKASGRFLRTTWSYENQGAPGNTVHVTFQKGLVDSVRQEMNPPVPPPATSAP